MTDQPDPNPLTPMPELFERFQLFAELEGIKRVARYLTIDGLVYVRDYLQSEHIVDLATAGSLSAHLGPARVDLLADVSRRLEEVPPAGPEDARTADPLR